MVHLHRCFAYVTSLNLYSGLCGHVCINCVCLTDSSFNLPLVLLWDYNLHYYRCAADILTCHSRKSAGVTNNLNIICNCQLCDSDLSRTRTPKQRQLNGIKSSFVYILISPCAFPTVTCRNVCKRPFCFAHSLMTSHNYHHTVAPISGGVIENTCVGVLVWLLTINHMKVFLNHLVTQLDWKQQITTTNYCNYLFYLAA